MMFRSSYPVKRCLSLLVSGSLLLFIWLTASCGGKKSTTEQGAVNYDSAAGQARDEVLKSLRESGITRRLSEGGSPFQQEALHDINKSHDYLQQSNKGVGAIQLGIYMSDLGYLMGFDKRDEARHYFEVCLLLSNHVGLQELFGKAVNIRFADIISGNVDLQKDLDRLFKHATNTAEDNEFKKVHAAALAGYYMEELYHLAIFVQSPPADGTISPLRLMAIQTVLSQKQEVGNLINYFDHLQLKPEGIALYQEFLKMQSSYQALDADRLLKENDPEVVIRDKNFNEILIAIVSIRMSITGS